MTPPTVAYQGAPGAFGEQAVRRYWGGRADPLGVATFDAAVRAVTTGTARYAVLPVWNSTIGRIGAAWSALAQARRSASPLVRTIGEVTMPVELCLLARPDADPRALRVALGHPAALAQSGRFLSERGLRRVAATDSAAAARHLAVATEPFTVPEWRDPVDPLTTAAVAPAAAASLYQLVTLARAVQDRTDNRTSFIVIESTVAMQTRR